MIGEQDAPHVVILGAGFGGLAAARSLAAAVAGADGKPLPAVAPVAKQQGHYVAQAIRAAVRGQGQPPPFRYRNYGNMATIGRKRAIADLGWLRLSGFAAWLRWCTAHIWFLAGYRNRLRVGANWVWKYVSFERNARLITGLSGSPPPTIVTQTM